MLHPSNDGGLVSIGWLFILPTSPSLLCQLEHEPDEQEQYHRRYDTCYRYCHRFLSLSANMVSGYYILDTAGFGVRQTSLHPT